MGQDESLPLLDENQKEIQLTNEKIEGLKKYIPENHVIESIDLSGNRIRHFPLILHHLKYLDMSKNDLNQVDFSNLSFNFDALEIIRLSGNNFDRIPEQLSKCEALVNVALDSNNLDENTDFLNFPNLKFLDLFLNKYRSFPHLPDTLQSLNLGFNSIKTISLHSEQLTELRLSGNEITEFDEQCFFPNLVTLDMSMNRMIALPPLTSLAPSLTKFNCSYNFLGSIASIPSSIVHLDLSHNLLETISFDNMMNLNTLDISFNNIKVLNELPQSLEHFNGEHNKLEDSAPLKLGKLNTLQINSNHFQQIPNFSESAINIFIMRNNNLTELKVEYLAPTIKRIDIVGNNISEIPDDLCKITKLQYLNVSFNKLTKLPDAISNVNLTSLFISGNNISDLPELPKCLITLIASSCNFKQIPSSIFNVPRLSSLDLSVNQISSIPVLPNIYKINLSMNKIDKVPTIPDKVNNLDLAHNLIKSIDLIGDFIMIQELNLSGNKLHSFNSSKLPILHTLKINNNKHLKMPFDFNMFPAIRILDISKTKIFIPIGTPLPTSLKDLSTSKKKFVDSVNNEVVRYINPKHAGYSEICGVRPTMEDAIIVRKNVVRGINMYSVIDGHAGIETATLAAHYIPYYFCLSPNKTISDLSFVFREVNKKLSEKCVKDGATIALALITSTEIGIAHLGDARALIVNKDGKVNSLTYDHKPNERSEFDLIKDSGSYVDSNRTAGILAVSRSLGDLYIPGVSHSPTLTCYTRKDTDYRLVICCDGVFDVLDNDAVGKIIIKEKKPNAASCLLRNIAFARGSQDNISVIVVDISL